MLRVSYFCQVLYIIHISTNSMLNFVQLCFVKVYKLPTINQKEFTVKFLAARITIIVELTNVFLQCSIFITINCFSCFCSHATRFAQTQHAKSSYCFLYFSFSLLFFFHLIEKRTYLFQFQNLIHCFPYLLIYV